MQVNFHDDEDTNTFGIIKKGNFIAKSTNALHELFSLLPTVFKHNTIPAVLMIGTACMAFHYKVIMSIKQFCPVPLAFGASGTGKTLALRCSLALFGAHNQHIFQHCTLQYYSSRCAECSIPFGIDDPTHSNELGELLLSVSNGTKRATVGRGSETPQSSPIITANFSLQDKATRCECVCKLYIPLSIMSITLLLGTVVVPYLSRSKSHHYDLKQERSALGSKKLWTSLKCFLQMQGSSLGWARSLKKNMEKFFCMN